MRNLLLLVSIAIITSCAKSSLELNTKEISGKWQLAEILADPGDGSGTWKTVENGKTLKFDEDGMVYSSTSFCYGEEINEASYDASKKMISSNCADRNVELSYELKEGNLFVYPHNPRCIETCGSKYKKMED
ncbi:hypothetical protein SAMN05660776_2223 [Salegentibacter holothuriorum]|uniref:Lipocalin-like domain-containing protein n=1 Tax=Salegentibacter holothuriorum TaxID=241145 RepID=A0A1T5CU18_9FLAO|nr:hypothetical protein [Salegentibacter holothuriorum]SKB62811.1 hypothetical protein SAMN05660776_2223 [Salegentibacter holothuriorum]